MVNPTILLCGHTACGFCLHEWLKSPKRLVPDCPQCRAKVHSNDDNIRYVCDFSLDTAIDGLIATLKALNHRHWVEGGSLDVERKEKIKYVLKNYLPFHFI